MLYEGKVGGRFYSEFLIGDDDEIMQGLNTSAEPEGVVQNLGSPAAVLRARLASVAIEYTTFNFNPEDLLPGHALCEVIVLSFLQLEDFTFVHPNVRSALSDIFYGESPQDYGSSPHRVLSRAGILTFSRSAVEVKKPDQATLSPEVLRQHRELPFVTKRVIEALDNLGTIQPPN